MILTFELFTDSLLVVEPELFTKDKKINNKNHRKTTARGQYFEQTESERNNSLAIPQSRRHRVTTQTSGNDLPRSCWELRKLEGLRTTASIVYFIKRERDIVVAFHRTLL